MDHYLHPDDEEIRISSSPRRSPQITKAVTSPTKSVHPQLQGMESISSQADFGHRTADFFDESSGDEETTPIDPASVAPDVNLLDRRGSATKKRRTASTVEPFATDCDSKTANLDPGSAGYHRLTPSTTYEHFRQPDTASSIFRGSVDELLPNGRESTPPPQLKRSSRLPSGRTPRKSSFAEQRAENRASTVPSLRADPTLGALAIAHEITLSALLRDEDTLDRSLQSFALSSLPVGDRNCLLASSLDPRSPRGRRVSSMPPPKKNVHVIPPPIDTTAPRHSMPEHIVRTPYPFTPDIITRKDFTSTGIGSPPPTANTTTSSSESILTLSIRRRNPHAKLRITTLTIPAQTPYTAIRGTSAGAKESHFRSLDFDDAELFLQIRRAYHSLLGPAHFLSARSLRKIVVSGSATRAADNDYGWRSPRTLAFKGLSDTFSEEQILRHFRKPALGRSRYAFVQWAHRIAAVPFAATPRTPQAQLPEPNGEPGEGEAEAAVTPQPISRTSLEAQGEGPEGLEFILTFSLARIAVAVSLVFVVSIAAVLLWTFLGKNSGSLPGDAGFRGAGDRVGTGILIGICVFLMGMFGVGGWVGGSWLWM